MFALRRLILAVLLLASSGSLLVWAANFYGDAGEPAKVLKVGLYENFPKVYTMLRVSQQDCLLNF